MSQKEKLLRKLLSLPKDMTFDEIETLMGYLDYLRSDKGKTSGSRVMFESEGRTPIFLHKPHHSGDGMKAYQLREIIGVLRKEGLL